MKKRLDVQKDEYEETIKRHLSFIDQVNTVFIYNVSLFHLSLYYQTIIVDLSSSVVKANRDFGKGFKQVLFDLVDFQLIDDKKNLSEKCEMLVKELKTVDKKYQDKIKTMDEK